MKSISALVRKNILTLKPYSSARNEHHGQNSILLDANENPFASGYNRYPDPNQTDLKKGLSKLKNVSPENIFIGNGSDEAIDLLIRIFCVPGKDSILTTTPTYGMYQVAADINDITVHSIPLNEHFELEPKSILREWGNEIKILFLCNPNNPTGNSFPLELVRSIIKSFNGIVVLDEAYIDFSSQKSLLNELDTFPNLAILQTFSKAWGMAGLRVGVCYASPAIISWMSKVKYPYNINKYSLELVKELLTKNKRVRINIDEIIRQRNWLSNQLKFLPMVVKVYPSDANFLLVKMTRSKRIYQYLQSKMIIVRDRSATFGCVDCLRITIGTGSENRKLIKALKSV